MRVVGHRPVKRKDGSGKEYIEQMPVERPGETVALLMIIALLERSLKRRVVRTVDAELQPKVLAGVFLGRWSRAVIEEYRQPHHCQACKSYGRPREVPVPIREGEKIVKFDWTLCDTCDGQGVVAWGVHRRAKMVRLREGTFRSELNEIHDGALALLRELEHRGAVMLVRRLGR